MKRPAVFFDRDNTLIANDGFLGDPGKVALIPGAAEAVARVRALGFAAVTFSNQSGVARGMFTEEAVHAVNSRLDEMLQDQNPRAMIDRHEFCPYHPQAVVERYRQDSALRKPKPGMILQAAERLGLDLPRSWVIGDAPRDIEAGKAVGCRAILFSDPDLKASPAAGEASAEPPDFVVTTLKEAVDIIERNTMSNPQTDPSAAAPTGRPDEPASESKPESKPPAASAKAPATQSAGAAAAAPRKMTFAERVRSGTFQPARVEPGGGTATERPKRAATGADVAAESTLQTRQTEPVSDIEQLEPLLQQILEEVRLMRQRQPYSEFSVSKLLAGIAQVLVLPALFFAYMHRDVAADLQSMLLLATVMQAMTIALLIMGRQS